MFLQGITDFFGLDFDFSTTLCLTLAHSLWQMALLAYIAKCFVRISCRKDAQWGYGVYVATLIVALLAIPATFLFLSENSLEVASLVIELTESPLAEPLEFAKPEATAPLPTEIGNTPLPDPKKTNPVFAKSFRIDEWAPKILSFYLVGVFIMLTRLGIAFLSTQYLARHGEPITVGPVVEALDRLIHAWGMRVRPVVTHASDIVVPQVVGLLKPTILIPTSALTGLTPAELEMILTHELAHIRRLDMWVNLLQRLAEAVLFFNPALWYLSRQISTYREYCCDEQTCGIGNESPSKRLEYAQALMRVVELAKGAGYGRQVTALAATGNRPSELRRRVARLFGEPLREPVGISRGGLLIVITGMALLFAVPIGWQNAAETEPSNSDAVRSFDFGDDETGEIEVLGVGTYEENPNRWWNKQGELLDKVPFHVQGATVSGESRQLVFRITNLPREANVKVELEDCGSNALGEVVLEGEESQFGYFSSVFAILEDSPTVDLRVGVAAGEWKTISAEFGIDSQSSHFVGGKSIAFAGAAAEEDRFSKANQATIVVVSHNFNDANVRVIAVDKSGKRHRSSGSASQGVGNGVMQTKYSFRNVLPNQLEHFEFQTREFEWIEVNELPVNPSKKVAAAPIDPAELTVEVVAIGTHDESPQGWWDKDGKPLSEVPFNWYDTDRKLPEGTTWRRVVIRVEGLPADAEHGDMTWRLPGARYYWGAYVKPTDPYDPGRYYARYFQWDGNDTFDLKMGLAEGEWQTVAKGNMTEGARREDIVISDPIESEDGMTVFVSHNVTDRPYRIMAVDRRGKSHRSTRGGGTSINNIVQSRGQFPGLGEDDVDHFEFQVRDYVWRDVKDVPATVSEQIAVANPGEENAATSELNSVDSAKLEALKELVDSYQTDYDRVEALFKLGVEGGEQATKSQAQVRLALARADLAEAKKDFTQRLKQLDIAFTAAEDAVKALEHKYAAGEATLGELSEARAERARVKMRRADIRNDVVREVEPKENKLSHDSQPEGMLVKVVDSDGKPLEGAWIYRNLTFNDPKAKRSRIENETYYTDKNGEATITFEGEPINLNMWVKKESHVPLVTSWRDVTKQGSEQIPASFEFRMTRGTKIGGIVTDVAGIPIVGAKVEVVDSTAGSKKQDESAKKAHTPGRTGWLAYGAAGVITDGEGRWSLDNVPKDEELVFAEDDNGAQFSGGPLRLRVSHADYETIEDVEPPLETLRDGSARAEMKWINKDAPERVNAVRLEQGQQYKNADFSGRHFKGQELMVWSDEMLAGANLVGSTWEDMMVPGVSGLLYEADMTDAKILNAQLTGQSSGLQKTNFTRATLETADLSGGVSGLQLAKFVDAKITNSSLYGEESAFQEASFENAKLHSTKLSGKGSAFQKSNFDGAKLYRTTISCDSPTAFQGVILNDTEFVECDLSSIDAEALRSCEFDTATPPRYDAKTKLPMGFDPVAVGWKSIE